MNNEDTTPSQEVKAAGLKSLVQVARICNKPRSTIENWHKYNHKLFTIVIAGCVSMENIDE